MASQSSTWVLGCLGGPNSGKSTLAAELFVHMKKEGYRVEFLQEYAKKLVWEKDWDTLNNQYHVSHKYYKTIQAMDGKVDFIILDSSLLNGLWYNRNNKDNTSNVEKTQEMILKWYYQFNNINFFIHRGSYEYQVEGRKESEQESKIIDKELQQILFNLAITWTPIPVDNLSIEKMMDKINCG